LKQVDEVFVPIFGSSDDIFLIDYAQKLMNNNDSKVTILDINNQVIINNFVMENSL
jgi:uncharacterized protein YihD (DUF1040 family)